MLGTTGVCTLGLGVVPFIITLGSLKVFRGVAKWLSNITSSPSATKFVSWGTRHFPGGMKREERVVLDLADHLDRNVTHKEHEKIVRFLESAQVRP